MTLTELIEKRSNTVNQMKTIADKATAENRDLTAEESAQFETLKNEERSIQKQIDRTEYLRSLERSAPADHIGDGHNKDFEKLKRSVSVANIIRSQMNNQGLSGAELEYNQEAEKRSGRKAQGAFIPFDALETRANTTTTASDLVPTIQRPQDYIGALRSSNIVRSMGVRTLTGLSGDVVIPKFGSGLSLGWINEGESVPESEMGFDAITLKPKHTGGKTEMSRQLIQQSSPDIESLVREDLSYLVAQNIDKAIIAGTGVKDPLGILNTVGVLTGAIPTTWQEVLALIQQIEDENITNLKWLGTSTTKTTLAGIEKSAGTGQFLYSGGQVGELPFNVSANMPVNKLILGDFSQVLLGVWSEIDILVNPYAEPAYSRGGVQVRAMATCDVAVRHPKAFLVATGA
ncbi:MULTISPECIES: phage major capsid protein [Acinetobacter]|uniref:phage major capsid protein n=1 Tax=Acinetobacter TaxID=469 RepID=UPI000CBA7580|nr:phage major capsid protein [Acinetobacter venetianus]PMC98644.1 phage major capsid protein [Acinetobacter ursingii]RZG87397.1 phage major capsid protein [Acinetobacter venetianus]